VEDKVFLYEYATCGALREIPPAMAVEGLGMFKSLEKGFSSICGVVSFVDPSTELFKGYPRHSFNLDVFREFLDKADECLVVAPESDDILYRLTRVVEREGCANLGSTSQGVADAADKYVTSKRLGHLSPKTEVYMGRCRTSLSLPLVAKPRDGVSGEGIFLVEAEEDLEKVPRGYLLQEYVRGKPMSAAFIVGDETILVSVNTQEIHGFSYMGARLPVDGIDVEPLYRAVERIKGLHGYVGVDFIHGSDTAVIEINPRPTTPMIAYSRAYGINVAEMLLLNYYHKPIPTPSQRRGVHLLKVPEQLKDSYISFDGYSILLRDWNEGAGVGHRRG
jgi:hypothetical protein